MIVVYTSPGCASCRKVKREFRSCKKYRILNRGLFTTFFYAYFCQILCIYLSYFIVFCDIILKGECYACYYY